MDKKSSKDLQSQVGSSKSIFGEPTEALAANSASQSNTSAGEIRSRKEQTFKSVISRVSVVSATRRFDIVSGRIVQVVVPVTVCALYCCLLIRVLSKSLTSSQPNLLDTTWQRLGVNVAADIANSSQASSPTDYLIIVGVFCVLIVAVTLLILLVFWLEWQQCLLYYFYLPSFIILALVTPAFLRSVLHALNLFAIDVITASIFTWNFTAVGMVAIFSIYVPSPLTLQQLYLIHNSTMISMLIIHALPGWAPWLLLTFLVLWDLFAVLAPYGPLNLIISMAEREGMVEMPGLIYSTDSIVSRDPNANGTPGTSDGRQTVAADEQPSSLQATSSLLKTIDATNTIKSDDGEEADSRKSPAGPKSFANVGEKRPTRTSTGVEFIGEHDIVERGVSIGLGDFIFYSLLIGLASKGRDQGDFYTVLTTLNSVQFGLVLTLSVLALTKRALPALPISISLGLSVAFLTNEFVPQLANAFASRLIFI